MTPAEFLTAVWPSSGLYVLATPATRAGAPRAHFKHKVFVTVSQAAQFVDAHAAQLDFYFGVHTLKHERLYNPKKLNPRTGEPGAYEVRTQANSNAAKCFFFDLDVGESTSRLAKYTSQGEALTALRTFCKATGLPRPLVVSSGGGLHVYWLLTESLLTDEWRTHAHKLKALASAHGLKTDPSRTTDSASVLRVAGTFNHKDPSAPRPVQVLLSSGATPTTVFLKALHDATILAGTPPAPAGIPGAPPALDWESNTDTYTGPPTTLKAVVTACEVMRGLVKSRGDVSEPEWYHMLNLVRFLENGETLVHKVSAGHPQYSEAETTSKVHQLEAKGVAPTSCGKLAEVTGSTACARCPFQGKVKSPIVAARLRDPAPPPIIAIVSGPVVTEVGIPQPPKPFARLKDGRIAFRGKNKDGDEVDQIIYDHDLYPLQRMSTEDQERQLWRVVLPRSGPKDFHLDSDALYDRRKFTHAIANSGVYPHPSNLPHLQDYMVAYIAELQRAQDAVRQQDHLGWTEDFSAFILPSKTILSGGGYRPTTLSEHAEGSSQTILQKGSLKRQVELLRFFNNPAYVAHQFLILGSLAAPIFYPSGYHGAVVNAAGEPGEGKSLALYTAASFWGEPEQYTLNGTSRGVTANFREQRAFTLSNLPLCVDEITDMPHEEARSMALNIGQAGRRGRLRQQGTEAKMPTNHKATLMLATANTSLHELLANTNVAGAAGSMRVFEIVIKRPPGVHTKHQADDYWWELRENYGWIGEAFVDHVVKNAKQVEERVRAAIKTLDQDVNLRTAKRFWSATAASVLVAGEIANELGLLSFNMVAIRDWIIRKQFPLMRGVVTSEYATPLSLLSDYIETIHGSILMTSRQEPGANTATYLMALRGTQMLAEYDTTNKTLWVLRAGFKNYCHKVGAVFGRVIEDLSETTIDASGKPIQIIPKASVKRTLGAGTPFAKMQTWCFQVNMAHPEVAGTVNLGLASLNLNPTLTPPAGQLKEVETEA